MTHPIHKKTRRAADAIGRIRGAVYNLRSLADEPHRACPIAQDAHEALLELGDIVTALGNLALLIEEE